VRSPKHRTLRKQGLYATRSCPTDPPGEGRDHAPFYGRGGTVISEERILGKFFCEAWRRPSQGAETLLVAKTWAPLLGKIPREYPLWGGGGDR
jgi:hypothetical protein